MVAHLVERLWRSALERIDRLFAVTDDKYRAIRILFCTVACGEFLGQLPDHGPLCWAGVLGFVDQ